MSDPSDIEQRIQIDTTKTIASGGITRKDIEKTLEIIKQALLNSSKLKHELIR